MYTHKFVLIHTYYLTQCLHTHSYLQTLQGDRDKAIQQGKGLYRKIEELRREKEEMQKRLDQKGQVCNIALT